MRITASQATARPVPADRNQAERSLAYSNQGVAPAGSTTRATYTVPANKKAQLMQGQVTAIRDGAAAPSALSQLVIRITTPTVSNIIVLAALLDSNTVGDRTYEAIGTGATVPATSVFELVTSDGSTGGSHSFFGAAIISEYDV